MSTIEVSSEEGELLDFEDAKRHLGVYGEQYDTDLRQLILEAREYCEKCTQRTLRPLVTRRHITDCWDNALGYLPWPPVREVSSVSYYPADGSSQVVLPSSSYRLIPSGEAPALLEWVDGTSRPGLANRSDAVTVEFVTGYGDPTSIPETAKAACRLLLTTLWNQDDPRSTKLAEDRAMNLLSPLCVGHY